MSISAKVIADSISEQGKRIITFQLRYPRFIHAELMTHRVFSRNASSSRAIPVTRLLKDINTDPAVPIHWGKNQPGMQARSELSGARRWLARRCWHAARRVATSFAWIMDKLGAHKQLVNRIVEPFSHISVVVTATEWENFYNLRLHPDAQPEIHELARLMNEEQEQSVSRTLHRGQWHLPYVSDQEIEEYGVTKAKKLSVARCARVSYLNHDGSTPDPVKDLKLFERLIVAQPAHASPCEHQASPAKDPDRASNNFRGWNQFRRALNV